jgi:hypothetical protein
MRGKVLCVSVNVKCIQYKNLNVRLIINKLCINNNKTNLLISPKTSIMRGKVTE